jgi:signal transduction histidine kinase
MTSSRRGDASAAAIPAALLPPDASIHGIAVDPIDPSESNGEGRHAVLEQLLIARLEERRSIAFDIHDGIAQLASGLLQGLRTLDARYPTLPPEASREVAILAEVARTLVGESRRLMTDGRATVLIGDGLETAIRERIDALTRDGFTIDYCSDLGDGPLPTPVEFALYRAACEAFWNIRKHAETTAFGVRIARSATTIRLDVTDRGRGFQTDGLPDGSREHVGLEATRARLRAVGGELQVTSTPGQGTTFSASVPIDARRRRGAGIPQSVVPGASSC